MSDSETTGTSGAVDRLAGLVDAAEGDRRARRLLLSRASRVLEADAEAERKAKMAIAEAEQRARAVESEAEARIRAAEARLRVQERERAANRAEREATRAEQVAAREVKAEAAELRRARWSNRRDATSAAAPAALSMLVYLAAVASAVFGQVSVATGRYHWALWRALLLAGFIELMALAMATTANRLRLRGERALAPRVLTWVFAGFAAAVNVWGHWEDPLMAIGLGAASLGGITLWEIRSSARHRDALRAVGQLAHPLPSLGLRFWLLQPSVAMAAYRIGIRTRVSAAAEPLVDQAMAQRAATRAARTTNGRAWPRVVFAGIAGAAIGVGATAALSGGRLADAIGTGTAWWITAAAATGLVTLGVIVPAVWRAGRRAAFAPAGQAGQAGQVDAAQPVRRAGQTSEEARVPVAAGSALECDESALTDRAVAAASAPTVVPAVLSPTGEFRALTAPEHYQRDAVDAHASLGPVLRAARVGESAAGSRRGAGGKGAAGSTTSMLEHTLPASKPRVPRVTASTARGQAASGKVSGTAPARGEAPRRGGIPDDARQWLAEELRAGRSPSGPEIGRRFRIDPSTGRRWLNRVRESLPAPDEAPATEG